MDERLSSLVDRMEAAEPDSLEEELIERELDSLSASEHMLIVSELLERLER